MGDQATEGILSSFLQKKRINTAAPYLNGRVLDVGCGTGALAAKVKTDKYFGTDIDEYSLNKAKSTFPDHHFGKNLPPVSEKFDTIVILAVIEHIKLPSVFLLNLSQRLKSVKHARIICTTPHPSMDWIHNIGSRIGIFSREANKEHEKLLDREALSSLATAAELKMAIYKPFLFGANQLVIFSWNNSQI
jgi:2-polyprenyl-3-methyl-5-hydroxy-6-metoxy-1,4-benzoquinol methylase